MSKNLLMISGDRSLAQGKHGAFYNTIEEFHKYWDRIDIITPKILNDKSTVTSLFGNVFIHSSSWPLWLQPLWILRQGSRILKSNNYLSVRHAGALSTNRYLMTVHEYAPFYNGIGGYLLHLTTRIPYIVEIMHIPGVPKSSSLKEVIYKYLTKFFISLDVLKARSVRVINQKQTRDFLTEAGVPPFKIKYIPAFYIDLNIFKPQSLAKKYDLIYIARLEKNKGIDNLIKAVSVLSKTKPDVKLVLIGQGPELENLRSQVNGLKLENNIEMVGWVSGPEDVARFLNESKVFINPSFNEGGPRVVLEAMACGLPVITTPVGLMIDLIKDGENGLLCDWHSESMAGKIDKMLKDVPLQERCSIAGQALVQNFEKRLSIKNYAISLQSLI